MSSFKTNVKFDEDKIMRALANGMIRGVNMISVQLNNNIVKRLNKKGTGIVYSGNKGRASSKEGEPPAPQTARLRNSWNAKVKTRFNRQRGKVFSIVKQGAGAGSAVAYGAILELPKSENGLNRPFLRGKEGAVNRTRPFADKVMRQQINAAIKKANRIT